MSLCKYWEKKISFEDDRLLTLWEKTNVDYLLVLRELTFLDNYRNAFMFIDFSIVLNMECHIGEFYPSLLRLTLEDGLKLFFIICWIILRWYQATFFIENCAMLKTSCIDLVPRTHAFFIRGDQCKKKKNETRNPGFGRLIVRKRWSLRWFLSMRTGCIRC